MKMPAAKIFQEIQRNRAISFARFMELALYSPGSGYYETKKNIGKRGDFYTSVSVGNLFGELLAFQFAGWLETELKNQDSQVRIIEAGAHDGTLTKDILHWLKSNRPELFSQIGYVILEPSETRRRWQMETLKEFSGKVFWATGFEDLKLEIRHSKFAGIIFGNELLDAFPVHRFGWDAKAGKWFELGVAIENENFVWTRLQSSERQIQLPSSIADLPSSLLAVLPDNYTIEISPAAENWWREAANLLQRGKLLALDYGFTGEEQFSPARVNGTLRAYHNHRASDDLLTNPGEQDLTAHVNFSAIQKAGEAAGMQTELFSTQTKFLTQILQQSVAAKAFDWNPSRARQFQTLTHPDHLGRAFRVLLQSKTI